ncbi:MAG: hypothetical protein JWO53_657 [Chlamydiia bacterium]|nr:hypothetical protein [Chlamydiia bacterium]
MSRVELPLVNPENNDKHSNVKKTGALGTHVVQKSIDPAISKIENKVLSGQETSPLKSIQRYIKVLSNKIHSLLDRISIAFREKIGILSKEGATLLNKVRRYYNRDLHLPKEKNFHAIANSITIKASSIQEDSNREVRSILKFRLKIGISAICEFKEQISSPNKILANPFATKNQKEYAARLIQQAKELLYPNLSFCIAPIQGLEPRIMDRFIGRLVKELGEDSPIVIEDAMDSKESTSLSLQGLQDWLLKRDVSSKSAAQSISLQDNDQMKIIKSRAEPKYDPAQTVARQLASSAMIGKAEITKEQMERIHKDPGYRASLFADQAPIPLETLFAVIEAAMDSRSGNLQDDKEMKRDLLRLSELWCKAHPALAKQVEDQLRVIIQKGKKVGGSVGGFARILEQALKRI